MANENAAATEEVSAPQGSGGKRLLLRIIRYGSLLIAIAIVAVIAGFVSFASHVGEMKEVANAPKSDAIVVLTGGTQRLSAGLRLLRSGKADRLLISGVHPDTGKDDIRRAMKADSQLFNCCVDLDYAALDTVGNAVESGRWLSANNYSDVLLVTSNYHMPRSLLEARRAYQGISVRPYPVIVSDLTDGAWMTNPRAFRMIATEYFKYLAALAGASPRLETPTVHAAAK